jgi:hypothetical protein
MATVYVTELSFMGVDQTGISSPVPMMPPTAEQTVAVTGASVQSNRLNNSTALVRICSDVVCSVAFGTNPTALTTSMRIPANIPVDFCVPRGAGFRVAVIANS